MRTSYILVSIVGLIVLTVNSSSAAETRGLARQALETEYFDGDYDQIFISIRSAYQNEGYIIEQSDLPTGLLVFSKDIRNKSAKRAATLALLPGGGAIYVQSWGLAALDILFWPWSVIWEIPIVSAKAKSMTRAHTISVTLADMGDKTEVRTTLAGEKFDAQYVMGLKRLYADSRKQMLIRDRPEDRVENRIVKEIRNFSKVERLKGRTTVERDRLIDHLIDQGYTVDDLSRVDIDKALHSTDASDKNKAITGSDGDPLHP